MTISVSPAFVIYAVCIGIMTSWRKCLCAVFALVLHETAHYAVALLCGEKMRKVTITPFGGVMEYSAGHAGLKGVPGVLIAAAGPLSNYLMICLVSNFRQPFSEIWIQEMVIANASLLLINLLPAVPLDGGRILFSLGFYFMGVGLMSRMLAIAGGLTGVMMLLIGFYGWAYEQTINLSLFVVGAYMIVYAQRGREMLLTENRYALLHERQSNSVSCTEGRITKIRTVSEYTPILDAMRWLGGREYLLFLCMTDDGRMYLMNERWVVDRIIHDPSMCFGDLCVDSLTLHSNTGSHTIILH